MQYGEDVTEREIENSYLTPGEVEEVMKPVEQASVMPLLIYSNRAYFEREVEFVLRKGWHAIAHVSQLQETGAFVTGDIAGEPIMIIRDKEGSIRALSNVCRHRGAQLLSDCGVAKAIICPYHTWAYNLNGTLRGAPHMNKIDNFDRKSIALPAFRSEIWNGFVFVNLDENAEQLEPQIADLTGKLLPFGLENWEVLPWRTVDAEWNWKASLENFSEAYHHVGVHQETIGKVSLAENARYEETNDNYSMFYVHIEHPDDEFIPGEEFPFPSYPGIPDEYRVHAPLANIYPTFHLLLNTNFALWLRIEVQDVNKHRLIWQWMLPPGSKAQPDFDQRLEFLAGLMGPVVEEDLEFLPRTRAAARSRAFAPGRYCDQERSVHQMHRWLIKRMSEANALLASNS
jgi:phenylpropionate dioxygenase-like ring-hydroxylating dioxygenase large terminal subunit